MKPVYGDRALLGEQMALIPVRHHKSILYELYSKNRLLSRICRVQAFGVSAPAHSSPHKL
jgi:hypothetical protein